MVVFAAYKLLDAVLYRAELLLLKVLTQDIALFAFPVIQREWGADGSQQLISIVDLCREFSDHLLVLISVPFGSPPFTQIETRRHQLLDCRGLVLASTVGDGNCTSRPNFEISHRRLQIVCVVRFGKQILLFDPVELFQDYAFGYFV